MTGMLKVTPEKLISTASEFQSQGSQIRTLTNQMLDIVKSLSSTWEGEAQQTYLTRFNALDGDMAQIQLKISEHVSDLQEMAAAYKAAEDANVSNIGGLSSDYISD